LLSNYVLTTETPAKVPHARIFLKTLLKYHLIRHLLKPMQQRLKKDILKAKNLACTIIFQAIVKVLAYFLYSKVKKQEHFNIQISSLWGALGILKKGQNKTKVKI
jgi:hypothetical protein